MTRIDFYVVDATDEPVRRRFACLLAEKAWRKGHRVYLHVNDDDEARQLDELLWSFRDASFLPHSLLGAEQPPAPVEIGADAEPGGHDDVLVNLADTVPGCFTRFERVSEIVLKNPESTERLRERWRYYRQHGYELHHHEIPGSRLAS